MKKLTENNRVPENTSENIPENIPDNTKSSRLAIRNLKRIVVKIGTNVLMGGDGQIRNTPNTKLLESISRQIIELTRQGKEVILVSSGAIGFGAAEMGIALPITEIATRQACAAIGQPILMQHYKSVFIAHKSHCAQLLLTGYDFASKTSYNALYKCINTLLDFKVVPIINENDSVSIAEIDIVFGDNDNLSAMVATKIQADLLVLLTDVDSLYTKNPKKFEDASPIPHIQDIDAFVQNYKKIQVQSSDIKKDAGTNLGTGGIHTKLQAAQRAKQAQCRTIIAGADLDNVLLNIMEGKPIGTLID